MLLAGSWNLDPWFVDVEIVTMIEIPIGYVGVMVSYVGREPAPGARRPGARGGSHPLRRRRAAETRWKW